LGGPTLARAGEGDRYVLIATVTAGSSPVAPSGNVIFRRNGKTIGRAKLNAGTATLILGSRARVNQKFVATFQGDRSFRPSTSPPLFG
jgi:hypothetical protein